MIRYGVIGTGMMGREHIANIAHLSGAEVVAVADPHGPSRQKAAAMAPAARQFVDYRELLASRRCDAVVIATPNMTHADVLGDVLEADLHVLVEKPLGISVADCRRIIEAASRSRGVIRVGLEYRYMAPFARLIEEVDAGSVGRIRMVSMREHRFPFLSKVGDWNRFDHNTGGTLVEKCCHFFDLMNLVMPGRPERVFASGGQAVNHRDERYGGCAPDIADHAYVVVEYDDGARAMLDLCMFAEATHNQQEFAVMGDAGKIEALVPEHIVRIGRRGEHSIGAVRVEPTPVTAPYEGHHHGSSFVEHQRFLEAIDAAGRPEATAQSRQALEAALLCVAMGVAGQQSMTSGIPVAVSDVL
ncbi:Gfo/Idh/MocA family protein [Candidatus Poriferisocius sp.]|uniref:Gfo/Idh/MocA family protein n=1 Tax=Candidatus Poriferisocius sp. TaxID=3101276 RepID=UPI003B5A8992